MRMSMKHSTGLIKEIMMQILKQGSYMNWVRRVDENTVCSEASLVESGFEGSAAFFFSPETYRVTDAVWSIHNAADPERRGEGHIPALTGLSVYADDREIEVRNLPDYSVCTPYHMPPGGWIRPVAGKSDIKSEPDAVNISQEWKKIRELFNEAIRGAYQAEFYLLAERGMHSLEEYEYMWESPARENYCRPYTGGMPSIEDWPTHTGAIQHYRTRDLYNKYLHFSVMETEGKERIAAGSFHDSFHEMAAEIRYRGEDGVITAFDVNALRVPYEPCWSLDHLYREDFPGKSIYEMKKRDLGKIVGGPMGCFHILDITAALAAAAAAVR